MKVDSVWEKSIGRVRESQDINEIAVEPRRTYKDTTKTVIVTELIDTKSDDLEPFYDGSETETKRDMQYQCAATLLFVCKMILG